MQIALIAALVLSVSIPSLEVAAQVLPTVTALPPVPSPALPVSNTTAATPNAPASAPATTSASATNSTSAPAASASATPAAAAPTALTATNGCATFCHRREIRALSATERSAFFAAVNKLNSGTKPSKYDTFVNIHVNSASQIHSNPVFLPWHRAYLREFEKLLQAIDPSICVPYWRWDLDSQAPEQSPILSSAYFGGNGAANQCVTNGAFANFQVVYPSAGCLKRNYAGGSRIGTFPSTEIINRVVSQATSYADLRPGIEMSLHPYPHNQIGGAFSSMASPSDPLFWVHHGLVDQIYWQWQQLNPSRASDYGDKTVSVSSSNALVNLPYKVSDVFDTTKLCYDYAAMTDSNTGDTTLPNSSVTAPPAGTTPPLTTVQPLPPTSSRYNSTDRQSITSLHYLPPITQDFIQMNGWSEADIRALEADINGVYDQLNALPGYVSPCALWKRSSLLADLLASLTSVNVDVPGVGRVDVGYNNTASPLQCIADIKAKAAYVAPNVELPSSSYTAALTKIIGQGAYAVGDGTAGALPVAAASKSGSSNDATGLAPSLSTVGISAILIAASLF